MHENTAGFGTAFTVSIEAREGVTTGISAHDRAHTVHHRDPGRRPADGRSFARPGHVFPLRARPGGVLRRAGQTEGSVDLARLAGLKPAGVICEIMNEDGSMARLGRSRGLRRAKHDLKIVTIRGPHPVPPAQRAAWCVPPATSPCMPTKAYGGEFRSIAYENDIDHVDHMALVKGEIEPEKPVLVRVHSECLTGDAFGSLRCDCGEQLQTPPCA